MERLDSDLTAGATVVSQDVEEQGYSAGENVNGIASLEKSSVVS